MPQHYSGVKPLYRRVKVFYFKAMVTLDRHRRTLME